MSDVRIVAGILDDACLGPVRSRRLMRQRESRVLPAGQGDLDRIEKIAAEKGIERRFDRSRGAGARRPAAPERTVRFHVGGTVFFHDLFLYEAGSFANRGHA